MIYRGTAHAPEIISSFSRRGAGKQQTFIISLPSDSCNRLKCSCSEKPADSSADRRGTVGVENKPAKLAQLKKSINPFRSVFDVLESRPALEEGEKLANTESCWPRVQFPPLISSQISHMTGNGVPISDNRFIKALNNKR